MMRERFRDIGKKYDTDKVQKDNICIGVGTGIVVLLILTSYHQFIAAADSV